VAHLGFQITSFTYPGVADADLFEAVTTIAVTAEASGFDSLWVMDHFHQIAGVGEEDEPMLEAYTTLAALAALTSRVKLGALVTGVVYRNPALLAKVITTLDLISGGRAVLGIGASWFEDEARAYGYDFPGVAERFGILEDTLRICRAMFSERRSSLTGSHASVTNAFNVPGPLQEGGPQILVGGGGERKTLRLVAEYADFCNVFGDLDTVRRKLEILDGHCIDVGRDPDTITKTRLGALIIDEDAGRARRKLDEQANGSPWGADAYRALAIAGDPDEVAAQARAYLDAGLDGLIVHMPSTHDLKAIRLAGAALRRAATPPTA